MGEGSTVAERRRLRRRQVALGEVVVLVHPGSESRRSVVRPVPQDTAGVFYHVVPPSATISRPRPVTGCVGPAAPVWVTEARRPVRNDRPFSFLVRRLADPTPQRCVVQVRPKILQRALCLQDGLVHRVIDQEPDLAHPLMEARQVASGPPEAPVDRGRLFFG